MDGNDAVTQAFTAAGTSVREEREDVRRRGGGLKGDSRKEDGQSFEVDFNAPLLEGQTGESESVGVGVETMVKEELAMVQEAQGGDGASKEVAQTAERHQWRHQLHQLVHLRDLVAMLVDHSQPRLQQLFASHHSSLLLDTIWAADRITSLLLCLLPFFITADTYLHRSRNHRHRRSQTNLQQT